MTPDELKRRCNALLDTHPAERPVSVRRLQEIAGVDNQAIWMYAHGKSDPNGKHYIRLDRAFRLLENGQIGKVRTGKQGPPSYAIIAREAQPEQRLGWQLRITPAGIRSGFSARNPNAFTALPRIIEPIPGTEQRVRHKTNADHAGAVRFARLKEKGYDK